MKWKSSISQTCGSSMSLAWIPCGSENSKTSEGMFLAGMNSSYKINAIYERENTHDQQLKDKSAAIKRVYRYDANADSNRSSSVAENR